MSPPGGSREPARWRSMRVLLPLALAALASACSTTDEAKPEGRIMVVDARGAPIQGALLMPEEEFQDVDRTRLTKEERDARLSDAQGSIHAELDDFFWQGDGCYHFRIHREGFEDVDMAVSRDLYPPVLRIELKAKPRAPN